MTRLLIDTEIAAIKDAVNYFSEAMKGFEKNTRVPCCCIFSKVVAKYSWYADFSERLSNKAKDINQQIEAQATITYDVMQNALLEFFRILTEANINKFELEDRDKYSSIVERGIEKMVPANCLSPTVLSQFKRHSMAAGDIPDALVRFNSTITVKP